MPDLNERDAKLVQWLNEAYAKEAELEADLTAHISLTTKDSYRKRLDAHRKETRDHKKRVAARIKKLGGSPDAGGSNVPGIPNVVGEVAGKAVAAVKGQMGMARAAVTEQAETHLRNAQEEWREEHVEVAIYTRIETLATEVGDRETAQLAKAIRRDEERMIRFLEGEMQRLVKDVVRAEIPSDQRAGRIGRSSTTRRKPASSTAASKPAARKTATRKTTARKTAARKTAGARS